nr:uncharacterized mitochondrial protein AtMg00810-like [Tanacetum cinerariifolium]
RTVSKVPGPKDMIKFILNTQDFVYTVDMFRDILHFPVKTPENPFIAPVNIETIKVFMNRVGYQGVVDKKFIEIPQRIKEDYHSIKDDIPLSLREEEEANCWRIKFTTKIIKNTIRKHKVIEREHDDVDFDDRLELESHKKNPEHVNDHDDQDDEKVDEEEGGEMGSLKTRTEEMQAPIPTKLRSYRTILCSDKNITQELDAWVEESVIDEDEVIPKDETPEIVWESRQEEIRCPVPKPPVFFGPQRNPNEPPSDPVDTPMGEKSKLDEDQQRKTVDLTRYHRMIGSLMYLTAARPDLVFVIPFHQGASGNEVVELYFVRTEYRLADIFTKALGRERLEFLINNLGMRRASGNEVVELYFVRTEYRLADIFTKALGRERLEFLINNLGMRSMSSETTLMH